MENRFDFIVVGAGAAGCVAAEKLSRNASCLLSRLEAMIPILQSINTINVMKLKKCDRPGVVAPRKPLDRL